MRYISIVSFCCLHVSISLFWPWPINLLSRHYTLTDDLVNMMDSKRPYYATILCQHGANKMRQSINIISVQMKSCIINSVTSWGAIYDGISHIRHEKVWNFVLSQGWDKDIFLLRQARSQLTLANISVASICTKEANFGSLLFNKGSVFTHSIFPMTTLILKCTETSKGSTLYEHHLMK